MHRIGEMREKMRYTRPDPFDMIESLSLEEKKSLLGYLSDSIRKMEASATKMTYLEERWMEIKRLMKSLDYEPYIDDQVEIEEIWDICEDLIKSGKIRILPGPLERQSFRIL